MIHTVKGFGTVNRAEIDVFLELSCFLDDPMDVGNLISGSSAFSKSSLNIWKFTIHILLNAGLENFVSAGFPAVGATILGEASTMVRPLSRCPRDPLLRPLSPAPQCCCCSSACCCSSVSRCDHSEGRMSEEKVTSDNEVHLWHKMEE